MDFAFLGKDQKSESSRLSVVWPYLPFFLTLCVGMLLSIMISFWEHSVEEQKIQNNFKLFAKERAMLVHRNVQENLLELRSIESFYAASQTVERKEFYEFVKPIFSRFRSIQLLAWAPRVSDEKRNDFEKAIRTENYPMFHITEIGSQRDQTIRASRRPEYFPLCYVEPTYGNDEFFGFDLASSEESLMAMNESKLSGHMTAFTKVMVENQKSKERALWIFLPIYANSESHDTEEERQRNLYGYVVGIFWISDIVEESLENTAVSGIDMYFFDESVVDRDSRFLYFHHSRARRGYVRPNLEKEADYRKGLHQSFSFEIAGKKWSILCVPAPQFMASRRTWQSWFILIIGFLITGMISGYIWFRIGRTTDIERLVNKRTLQLSQANEDLSREIKEHQRTESKLRDSEEKWRSLVESAPDLILTVDLDGKIVFMNPTGHEFTQQNIVGTNFFNYIPPEYINMVKEKFQQASQTGETQSYDTPLYLPNQSILWFRNHVGVIKSGEHVVALMVIATDITKLKRAEEEIQHSRQYLNKIINSVADPIFVKDRQHRWVLLNDAFCEFVGYARETLTGKSDYEFFPKHEADVFWEKDELVFQSGKTQVNEEEITDKSGKVNKISTKKTLYEDNAGNHYIVGIIRDMTERRRAQEVLQESERRYADLFESAPDPIVRFNEHGCFESVNPAAEKIMGLSKDELIGKHFTKVNILSPASLTKALTEFKLLMEGIERPPVEYDILRGETVSTYEANPKLIRKQDGKISGLQIIFRNVSERKKREELEIKSQFISTVSHELRTPLHTIREGISVILDGSTGAINNEQRDFLEITKRNVERLSRLINNVLDFQKWESGDVVLYKGEYNINDLVTEIQKTMASLIKSEGLEMKLALAKNPPKIKFDRDKIMQVLINLTDNAIKFTKKGWVKIITEKTEHNIKVSVQDTGVGIKTEDIGKLFKAFGQLESGQVKRSRGTGLGLAITKKIIDEHHGQLWVESEEGKGSIFIFTLPIV